MEQHFRQFLLDKGVSLAGFADITHLPREQTGGFSRAVSIAIALDPRIVAAIPTGPHVEYSYEYDSVNKQLDEIGEAAEQWLGEQGCKARALTRKRAPYDRDTCVTAFPYKTAATLAGLGWIGKSALLVTPEYGSAQRLSCILTNGEFSPGKPAMQSRCGSCAACVDICPGNAISGKEWRPGTARDDLVSFRLCQEAVDRRGRNLPVRSVTCGLCIAACPHTKRYTSKGTDAAGNRE